MHWLIFVFFALTLEHIEATTTKRGRSMRSSPSPADRSSKRRGTISSADGENPNIRAVSAETLQKIDDAFAVLQSYTNCRSLLKKYLTFELKETLKHKMTPRGATLYDVIRSGAANCDAGVGVYAPDAESYTVFAPLFDPIINDYHKIAVTARQPRVNFGEGAGAPFEPLDDEGKYIISTRIRCARTLKDYPFNPLLTADQYLGIQATVRKALDEVEDEELRGTYYPLEGMEKSVQDKLIADHFLFKSGDRHLEAASACNFWPTGRGIFHNAAKSFLVWVNEEDHVRLIAMQKGGDVGAVFERLTRGVRAIERETEFVRDRRLGWLTFCPTNLGSTVRASVHIRLRHLAAQNDFAEICANLKLDVRGVHGEHSQGEDGVYDISNKARLGFSEYEAVKQMYTGVKALIVMERKLEAEKSGLNTPTQSEAPRIRATKSTVRSAPRRATRRDNNRNNKKSD